MRVGGRLAHCLHITVFVMLCNLPSGVTAAKEKFRTRFSGSIVSEYTDNLFHFSDEELAEFDDERAPGEQFFGLESPEDIVTRIRGGADLVWRLAKKRRVSLDFRATYYLHSRNSISDYPRFNIGSSYDITKKDAVYGVIDLIRDRFWKNYKIANTSEFAPAIYDQEVLSLGYMRDIRKRWRVGIEYRRQNRDYDSPMEARDRDGDYLLGYTTYRISKERRIRGESLLRYGDIQTPTEIDNGVPENRSYNEWMVGQSFHFDATPRISASLDLNYRQREATTPFMADLARFDRVDRRYRIRAAMRAILTDRLVLRAQLGYTRNDSDRIDPTIQVDELGYEETTFGVGLRYAF